jgi:type IV pilus assembly protein PilC
MAKFSYQAINQSGGSVSGTLEADSKGAVQEILGSRGLIPGDIRATGQAGGWSMENINTALSKVKAPDLILFSKQLATMLRAGVPILRIFQVLESQTENLKLRRIISTIIQDIQEGSSLHKAFSRHPRVFSPLYCSMVEAGETAGSLPEVLERLIYIIQHEFKIRNDIKSAMTYPALVVVALSIAFFVLLTFVVPKFVSIFAKAGIDIPWPTQVAMTIYQFWANYWYLAIGGVVAAIVGLVYYFRTPGGRLLRDTLLLEIPLIGPVLKKSVMSRFASIFAILQSSGVGILNSMEILSATINNAAVSREFDKITDLLKEGRGIAGPLRNAKYFTPMVINMVAIGEESGNLDEMLREVAAHYDSEVAYSVDRMTTLIGPILVVGLAAVVGFFALAIFLPMWDMTKMASKM